MPELRHITHEHLTSNREIQSFLAQNEKTIPAVVTRENQVFMVFDKMNSRISNIFFRMLDRQLGAGKYTEIKITPIEFDQLLERLRAKPRGSTAEPQVDTEFNASLEWVFNKAISMLASDVYLFIGREETRLEMKVYGMKEHVESFNVDLGRRLASLIWQEGEGQYDQTRPCDSSFGFDYHGKTYHIRANSLNTHDGGNAIACRIRDPKQILTLDEMGYAPDQIIHLRDMIIAPGGGVLFTGPTNSGKSTSVAGLMYSVPTTDYMIEFADPIEVDVDNCAQVELDRHRKDHDEVFQQILGALVRQNPDILVLGEIRDRRTAQAAVNMALQGKRVYSTLHSATAMGVFSRLEGLGVPDHVLALPDFIAGIVSQNLVPLVCQSCCLNYSQVTGGHTGYDRNLLHGFDTGSLRFINPQGCPDCIKGVSGQTLIAEVHPYVNDAGEVYEIITRKEYHRIPGYMGQAHQVLTKAQHAHGKIIAGIIDPLTTMRIIGGFDAGTVADHSAAQNLRTNGTMQTGYAPQGCAISG